MSADALLPIRAAVQQYAWGLPGSKSLAARLYALNKGVGIQSTENYAELWVGTHPSGPATLPTHANKLLSDFLTENSRQPVPFLLKCLSVAKPLSIQAHPDKQRANILHNANPTAYKDDNHKPEMCVALTGKLCANRT